MSARQRVDLWLWRARLTKTRAAASRLIGEGAVRLMRDGQARRLDKPAAELAAGDGLVFALDGQVRAVLVLALAPRRGPPAEARALYSQSDDIDPLA